MLSCDGISDHASWNEVFHYWDTKLSWITCNYPDTLQEAPGPGALSKTKSARDPCPGGFLYANYVNIYTHG